MPSNAAKRRANTNVACATAAGADAGSAWLPGTVAGAADTVAHMVADAAHAAAHGVAAHLPRAPGALPPKVASAMAKLVAAHEAHHAAAAEGEVELERDAWPTSESTPGQRG